MRNLLIQSRSREELIDITAKVQELVQQASWRNGALMLFCLHTTCGLTINEGADPDVRRDLIRFFNSIAPHNGNWAHVEGNTDAHIRSSLLGVSLLVPLREGRLILGRWQSIYLYEGDGPRTRELVCQWLNA